MATSKTKKTGLTREIAEFKERRIVEEISRGEGKPEAALPKIVEGRVGAFFKQVALLEQDYARDNKMQIKQVVEQAGLTITGFARFRVGS